MKTPLAAVTGLNWKTALSLGAVLVVLVLVAYWILKRAPGDAANAAGDAVRNLGKQSGAVLDDIERTVSDPNNRTNRVANALLRPVLGINDYTGKPNTIGQGIEEGTRTLAGWLGFGP